MGVYYGIKNYQHIRQQMRGIQINNYFNNHITLNGKKVNQQSQPVLQTNRPKPLCHVVAQPDVNVVESKPFIAKNMPTPLKKRTNTLVQLKKHLPQKRSISTERQRNATSAKKKEEVISDEEEKDVDVLANMSNRKIKTISQKGGLGKRSKSTIIKSGNLEVPKEIPKKESKKISSNPTTQSVKPKSKRKKSSKISEFASKETKTPLKVINARKDFLPVASKEVHKKQKMSIKIDKNKEKKQGDKKSSRSHVKSNLFAERTVKPVSAREKKSKKSRFIEELKEKYENQTILDEQMTGRIKSGGDKDQNNIDNEFLSVMSNLEKVLTSVGSKQKLKKQLEMINQKLKEFKLEDSDNSDGEKPSDEFFPSQKSSKIKEIASSILQYNKVQQQINYEESDHQEEQDEMEQDSEEQPLKNINHNEEEEDDVYLRVEGQQIKNPMLGKRMNNFLFIDEPEEKVNDDLNERKKEIELLKKFKNESSKMMEKVGLTAQVVKPVKQQESNPKKLVLNNVSGISSSSNSSTHSREDKYPLLASKSPKFNETDLMSVISLKQQFLSSKHDKMSELVKKMFEKQLVSPRSFEWQMKSLNKKYEEENNMIESFKKQAEQMSSLLSEIKKDKEEIQGIDELIRNEKWEEAQKLVDKRDIKLQQIVEQKEEKEQFESKWKREHEGEKQVKKDIFELSGWEKEQGWQKVKIKRNEVENNEFVDLGEMTNRGRRRAQAEVEVDIDHECGNTEQSVELGDHEIKREDESEDQYIYYNEENDNEPKNQLESGLIRLVEVSHEEGNLFHQSSSAHHNKDVFRINNEEPYHEEEINNLQRNNSLMSGNSSQNDRKGFTTNLYFIKEYCIALCEFVRDNQIFKTQFKNNVSKPLQFNIKKILEQLRDEQNSNYVYSKRSSKPAISEMIWNQFNNQYESLKCNSGSGKSSQRFKIQKEQELIFVRMIYDVLNESLDFERPGGQFGKAIPWKESSKHLKNLKQLNKTDHENVEAYDLMFGVAIARIIQWGSCLCGFLPDTVELQNTQIDEPYVNHIRQTRMAFLLQKMMAEQESLMTNFELQDTDVEFKLSQLVYQELIKEVSTELQELFEERQL